MKFWTMVLVVLMGFSFGEAEASKRLGGGKSVGRQSSNVTQRDAAPTPTAPTQNTATPARPNTPATPAAAAPAKRPWGAMLGGLAAGLGLAWLAHSLGLGEGMGQLLLLVVLAVVAVGVIRWLLGRRSPAATPNTPFAFQGASAAGPVKEYRPENVGNDASARPWERSSMAFEASNAAAQGGSIIGSGLKGSQNWGIPEGFDTEGFLAAAKNNFVTLQAAWDRSDIATLRSMMTDGMVDEIRAQLAERERAHGAASNKTEVVMLEARLLGIEQLPMEYMASVEFSGMIREEPSAGPNPFREVWNMTKPVDGSRGWLVAGVQGLQ